MLSRRQLTLLLFALALAIYAEYWLSVLYPHPWGEDFNIYYRALESAQSGGSPYLPYVIGVSFVYHPFALTLVSLFGVLGPLVASLIWAALNVAGYAASLWMSIRLLRDQLSPFWIIGLFVLFAPAWEMVHIGQINGIVLVCLIGSLYLAERDKSVWAGIALALAIVLKSSPLIFVLYFLIMRRWKVALVALVTFVIFSLIAWAQFGSMVVADYFTIIGHLGTETHPDFYNESAPALILRLLAKWGIVTADTAPAIEAKVALAHKLGGALLTGFALGMGIAVPPRDSALRVWLFGLLCAIMVVASPLVWYHHNVFLLLPLLILLTAHKVFPRWAGIVIYFLIQIERLFEEIAPSLPYEYHAPDKFLTGMLAYAGLPVLIAHALLIAVLGGMIVVRLARQSESHHMQN